MNVFLNSYLPLCSTKRGRDSTHDFGLFPFVDGSCRREPDFEKLKPAITCLCRKQKLLPRLEEGDLVIYITNKRRYYKKDPERFFIGILEVEKLLASHEEARQWYEEKGYVLSQNIICNKTEPLKSHFTHRITRFKLSNGEADIKLWNGSYRKRSRNDSLVAQAKVWNGFMELNDPRKILDKELIKIFHRIPGVQNPPMLKEKEWDRFQNVFLR